jgi:hypothetical protein
LLGALHDGFVPDLFRFGQWTLLSAAIAFASALIRGIALQRLVSI